MSGTAPDGSVSTARWEIIMPEHSETVAVAAVEQAATETQARVEKAREAAVGFLFGAQKLALEEFVFASNELIERAQTEMHLLSELVSKMAGAHSVKDIRTMYEECTSISSTLSAATAIGCSDMANGW